MKKFSTGRFSSLSLWARIKVAIAIVLLKDFEVPVGCSHGYFAKSACPQCSDFLRSRLATSTRTLLEYAKVGK